MKERLPKPALPKTRIQMAKEYRMHVRAFNRKLAQAGIHLPNGKIMPADQVRTYRALGAPICVWIDSDHLVPYMDESE